MIILVAALAILLLIAVVLVFHYKHQAQEMRVSAHKFEQKWIDASQELIMAKAPQLEDSQEQNSFVRTREIKRATPETYRNVFDLDVNGQRVLDDLQLVFASKSTYVRGGQEAERESCFRAGGTHVINHIFKQINKANDPNYKDEVDE